MNLPKYSIIPIISALVRNKVAPVIIVVQAALTLALVSNALSLALHSVYQIERSTGLVEDELFSIVVNGKRETSASLMDKQALSEVIGVQHVSMTHSIPLSADGSSTSVRLEAESSPDDVSVDIAMFYTDSEFIPAAGAEIIAGRNLRPDEVEYVHAPSDMVDKSFLVLLTEPAVEQLFPDIVEIADAVGKTIYLGNNAPANIVGIVRTLHGYNPYWDNGDHSMVINQVILHSRLKFLVRAISADEIYSTMEHARQSLQELNPGMNVPPPERISKIKSRYYAQDYMIRNILIMIVAALLVVSALGIVGMTMFNISNRTKQIGTLRALGATKTDIILRYMTENMILLVIGVFIGIVLAGLVNHYLAQFFQVEKLSVQVLFISPILVLLMGQLSAFWPAKNAATISPAIATRTV